MRTVFLSIFLTVSLFVFSQESIKVMQYNLMYYGKNTSFCTSVNNNQDHKNQQMKTIVEYVQPDILCVNEMDASLTDVNALMNNALNVNGISHWKHASVSGDYLINMLYYNSEKIKLVSQESINGDPRETNVYHLALQSNPDIVCSVLVTHLKAGSYNDNQSDRAYTTEQVMDYLQNREIDNYIIAGDFNVTSASEVAFQNLINPTNSALAFNDPINQLGNWHNNSSFSDVHTQSTHSSDEGCFSSGGIDDRFDFIMISNAIKNGTNQVIYESNSYETIGQDGNHYNQAINAGSNSSAPSYIIDALYEMSDHLPVCLNLSFDNNTNPSFVVFKKDFEDQDLNSGGWTEYSVLDDTKTWHIPSNTYGHNNSYCAKMSGWDNASNTAVDNEDWLISPVINIADLSNFSLHFWTAGKYDGVDLQLLYSNDYVGSGDPHLANWQVIEGYHLAMSNDFSWYPSGNISLDNINGEYVHLAFKYVSNPQIGAKTWEIDDIELSATTSINALNQSEFKIYPNPAQNKITVSVVEEKGIAEKLYIFNTMGICVYSSLMKPTDKIIDVSHLPSGVYLVRLGKTIRKFVKE